MTHADPPRLRGPSPWWFPATYLLHATEEYCTGETFPVWISRLANVHFTAAAFLWLNGIAMAAMLLAAGAATRGVRWLATTLATVVTINGAAHFVGSFATWTWSPGVVTGSLLWLPLGVTTLVRTRRELPSRTFAGAAALGFAAHAIVSGVVLCTG
ncbi:MAG: HXXEE domain-containing protein [Planctomycetes bacterium]|nr:HXXEE domain-containing protein [Planctomycetota bacterium]